MFSSDILFVELFDDYIEDLLLFVVFQLSGISILFDLSMSSTVLLLLFLSNGSCCHYLGGIYLQYYVIIIAVVQPS